MKEVLRGKFLAINIYIIKEVRSQINNLPFYFRTLEKEKQTQPKASRRRKILKIRADISELENRKAIERIRKTKNCFLKKINKIDKPLFRLTKKRTPKSLKSRDQRDFKRIQYTNVCQQIRKSR